MADREGMGRDNMQKQDDQGSSGQESDASENMNE